jgi:hypothetical protein
VAASDLLTDWAVTAALKAAADGGKARKPSDGLMRVWVELHIAADRPARVQATAQPTPAWSAPSRDKPAAPSGTDLNICGEEDHGPLQRNTHVGQGKGGAAVVVAPSSRRQRSWTTSARSARRMIDAGHFERLKSGMPRALPGRWLPPRHHLRRV